MARAVARNQGARHRATTIDGGTTPAAIRPLLRRSMLAVDGDAVATHGVIVCGTTGVPVTADPDEPTTRSSRPRDALAGTRPSRGPREMRTHPATPLYVLWHYPPFDAHSRPGPCVERLEQAGVTACVYGHLHNRKPLVRRRTGHGARRPLSLRGGRRDRLSTACESMPQRRRQTNSDGKLCFSFLQSRSGERAKRVTTFVHCIRRVTTSHTKDAT